MGRERNLEFGAAPDARRLAADQTADMRRILAIISNASRHLRVALGVDEAQFDPFVQRICHPSEHRQ